MFSGFPTHPESLSTLTAATGYYALQTTSALAVPQIRIVAKYSGAGVAVGDYVEVKGWLV